MALRSAERVAGVLLNRGVLRGVLRDQKPHGHQLGWHYPVFAIFFGVLLCFIKRLQHPHFPFSKKKKKKEKKVRENGISEEAEKRRGGGKTADWNKNWFFFFLTEKRQFVFKSEWRTRYCAASCTFKALLKRWNWCGTTLGKVRQKGGVWRG